MNGSLGQLLVVAPVVGCACGYAALKLMPAAWRKALAAAAARRVAMWGLSDVAARRVEAKLSSGGACGSCETCKACATPPSGGADDASVSASSSGWKTVTLRRVD